MKNLAKRAYSLSRRGYFTGKNLRAAFERIAAYCRLSNARIFPLMLRGAGGFGPVWQIVSLNAGPTKRGSDFDQRRKALRILSFDCSASHVRAAPFPESRKYGRIFFVFCKGFCRLSKRICIQLRHSPFEPPVCFEP